MVTGRAGRWQTRPVDERAAAWWSAAADLLLGAACPGCGEPWWGACPACRAHLLAQPVRVTSPSPAPEGFPPTVTASDYDDVHRGLLAAHKEHQALMLTGLLGDRLAAAAAGLLASRRVPAAEPITLVPVPSASAAVRRRGFDATTALARRAAHRLAATRRARVRTLLTQRAGLADQAGLDSAERAANLSGGLRMRGGLQTASIDAEVPGVIVVDDLVTTGASLTEAARCLAGEGLRVLGAATVSATARRRPRS